jgi:hypothetical protein
MKMSVDLNARVVVKNLCEWDLYFPRIERTGDVKLVAKGINRLEIGEIQAQVYANNAMFTGIDGRGSHAKIFIEDKDARVFLGFEDEDGKEVQNVLTPDKIKKLFEYKTQSTFEKHVKENVLLDSEKLLLVEEAKKLKVNDFDKIKFIEEYTGFKFETKK